MTTYLATIDFDGAAGNTFEPCLGGYGVEAAYRRACGSVFGSAGSSLFDHVGGLKNRSPSDLVRAILTTGDREQLIGHARDVHRNQNGELKGFVPQGKGAGFDWRETCNVPVLAEMVVAAKLSLLMPQIGKPVRSGGGRWPEPCTGFVEFWKMIATFNAVSPASGVRLLPCILSSGHELFIQKCFELWGLASPTFIVSDDTMRMPEFDHWRPEERTKPSSRLLEVVRKEIASHLDEAEQMSDHPFIGRRMFHAGDCLDKDGKQALCSGSCFVWFNQNRRERNGFTGQTVEITDWQEFGEDLLTGRGLEMMRCGWSFVDIAEDVFKAPAVEYV